MIERFGKGRTVMGVALPGLVEMIEDGLAHAPAVERFLQRELAGAIAEGADTYVLACTHYGFARDAIEAVTGPGTTVIDPAEPVARQALRVSGGDGGSGSTVVLTTADPVRMRRQVRLILGWDLPVGQVETRTATG
jgi:glutamate racemase